MTIARTVKIHDDSEDRNMFFNSKDDLVHDHDKQDNCCVKFNVLLVSTLNFTKLAYKFFKKNILW